MNIKDIKAIILTHFPYIEIIFEKEMEVVKLENILSCIRLGMGYKWNLILFYSNEKIVKIEYECCTYESASVNFCKILSPPKKVRQEGEKIVQKLAKKL